MLRRDPLADVSVVLCHEHFEHGAIVSFAVHTTTDTMYVKFKGFVADGGEVVFDVDEFVDFYTADDVTFGDNI